MKRISFNLLILNLKQENMADIRDEEKSKRIGL